MDTKQGVWLLSITSIITVILVGILIFVPAKHSELPITGTQGLAILSLRPNQEISSPLKITGTVNGNGWSGFEGQVGNVSLLDDKGSRIGSAILKATTDWMSPSVGFQTYLQFSSDRDQDGKLIFNNEDPSGLPDKNREYILPVKIKKGSGEIMKVKAFFSNSVVDPETSCNKVFAVERDVPKTTAVAKAALDELLKGLTDVEKNAGFFTAIPAGSALNSISIVNGEARVDFNETTESGGGSCSMTARTAQISQTLMQFPTITSVKLSINGRTGDIFQP